MDQSTIKRLVEAFEGDVLFDCHSLVVSVSRSQVSKEISHLSDADKNELRDYLNTHQVKTGNPVLRSHMEKAWNIVL